MADRHIGRLIHYARTIKRLDVDELARRCNVSRSRFYQWEKAEFILKKNLQPLAQALGVPLAALERENGPQPKRKPRKNPLVSKIGRMQYPGGDVTIRT